MSLQSSLASLFYSLILPIPAILIAMSVHELCHGFVADRCGDPTPRATGRLSLNPLHHIHPLGFITLLFVGFGFAKPVQVNPNNLKKPRRDMALVALAGPLSNLLMAFFGTLILILYTKYCAEPIASLSPRTGLICAQVLFQLLQSFVLINLGFFTFNIIPLPPLDGSHILFAILPARASRVLIRYQKTFYYIFLGLIILSILSARIPALASFDILSLSLGWVRSTLYRLFLDFWGLFPGLCV